MTTTKTLRLVVAFTDLSQDMVELTVPADTSDDEIKRSLTRHNALLYDNGVYETSGWNTETLMNHVCTSTGWAWSPVTPDLVWVDSDPEP